MKILKLSKKIYFYIFYSPHLLNFHKYLILKRLETNRKILNILIQLKLFYTLDQKELLKVNKDIKEVNSLIQKLEKKLLKNYNIRFNKNLIINNKPV